jgi:hypothetical protein
MADSLGPFGASPAGSSSTSSPPRHTTVRFDALALTLVISLNGTVTRSSSRCALRKIKSFVSSSALPRASLPS